MSNTRKARIAYTGEALNNGTMPVKELAPALLAFAELVENSYKAIGGTQKIKVLLSQDSIHKGSFDITFILTLDVISQIQLFVSNSKVNGLDDLMTVLGWAETAGGAAAFVGGGIFALIKTIKDRKIKSIDTDTKGAAVVTLADNTEVSVAPGVLKVFLDAECRANIERVVKPIRDDIADGFQLRNPADISDKEPILNINQSESIWFKAPPVEDDEIFENTTEKQTIMAYIVSVNFADGKWRLSDGVNIFWATIADAEFLKQIDDGNISFSKGDYIQVEYYVEQKMKAGKLTAEYIVTKVLQLYKKPKQIKLEV